MSGGSVYNFLHKQRGVFKFPALLKVALDVSKGMNYLHQNNIIHRDLKTANLLMDEHEVTGFLESYVIDLFIKSICRSFTLMLNAHLVVCIHFITSLVFFLSHGPSVSCKSFLIISIFSSSVKNSILLWTGR